jgi:hypothetical protein
VSDEFDAPDWALHDEEGTPVPNSPPEEDVTIVDLKSRAWRFAPWNEEAEESLVGAMLLSQDAIRAALRDCDAEDLWSPELASIYRAVAMLYRSGEPTDVTTVYNALIEPGGRERVSKARLLRLQSETPASANAAAYAKIIRDYRRAREAMQLGHELMEVGRSADWDRLDDLANEATRRLSPSVIHVPAKDLTELWALAEQERDDPTKPWVIPGCLRTNEVYALTGSEGLGKSLWLRQIGACVAACLHPFTGLSLSMTRSRVLYVDLQEDEVDMADEISKLRRAVESSYEDGWYHAVSLPGGLDLLSSSGQRTFEGLVTEYRPRLVIIGPVQSMYKPPSGRRGYDADVIEDLRAFMVDEMARYDFALALEGHAGNDRSHDEDWRIRGSSVWRSWPAFSHALKEVGKDPREVDVIRARRDRYAERVWPTKLYEKGGRLPWAVSNGDYAAILRRMGLGHLLGESVQEALGSEVGGNEERF